MGSFCSSVLFTLEQLALASPIGQEMTSNAPIHFQALDLSAILLIPSLLQINANCLGSTGFVSFEGASVGPPS